jgi:hypothetical protein
MNKEFIPYEQALELKELGFDEPCMFPYHRNNTDYIDSTHVELANYNATEKLVSAVLYQQAFRWFREKTYTQLVINEKGDTLQGMLTLLPLVHLNCYEIQVINAATSYFTEYKTGENIPFHSAARHTYHAYAPTYEAAELACLKKLIEIVKNK